jgi:sorbitol-specific phosphotransferase system component IIA
LIAPSQLAAAVAGVQAASRQHSSFEPFFHTVPSEARQLSIVWAPAAVARAAEANNIATLFSFFMVLLMGKKAAASLREIGR